MAYNNKSLLPMLHIYAGSYSGSTRSSLTPGLRLVAEAEGKENKEEHTLTFKASTPKWHTSVQFLFHWPLLYVGRRVVLLWTEKKRLILEA